MSNWIKQPPWQNKIYQGCTYCPPIEKIAPLDMLIAVGFGMAQVSKDDEIIFDETQDEKNLHALSEFEKMAKQDPDHDWQVILEGPLRGRTYQRHEENKWVLIDSNGGFA